MYTLRAGARSGGVLLIERKKKKERTTPIRCVRHNERKKRKRKKNPQTRVCSESRALYVVPGIRYGQPHRSLSLRCHLSSSRCRPSSPRCRPHAGVRRLLPVATLPFLLLLLSSPCHPPCSCSCLLSPHGRQHLHLPLRAVARRRAGGAVTWQRGGMVVL